MRFEHPSVFWAFLLLVIPILIHLFHFKRFKTLYFSSLIFIKQVEQESKSVKKLKHLLILISRLLAFTCLVIAFAKPYFPIQPNENTSRINAIYIDNSFSMTSLGENGQLFEIAKTQARNMVQKMNDDESFYIVSNNLTPLEQRKYNKSEAIERINQLTFSPISKKFNDISNWIQTQADGENEGAINRLIYFSDFQNDSIDANLLLNKNTDIYSIQLIAQKSSNVSIDTAWFTNPNFRVNQNNELNVVLRNYGKEKVENIALNLKTNQTQRDIFVDIRPNDTALVTVNYKDDRAGWTQGKLSVFDEGIIFDDDLFFSYEVKNKSNVYIINGEDAVPNVQTVYSLEAFYETAVSESKSINNEYLQRANTIVLNGMNTFPSGLIEQLKHKAEDGTSILIFPGNSVRINEINQLLSQLKLPSLGQEASQKFRITKINTHDLFYKNVFTKIPNSMALPTAFKFYNTQRSGNAIALLTLENESPILLKSTQNNTFLFTSSLSSSHSNFTGDEIFSTTLLRAGEISHSQQPIYLSIGGKEKFPILQENPENPIKLSSNDYEFIPMKTFEMGKSWITLRTLDMGNITAGTYSIDDKGKEIGLLSMNYNRAESSIIYTPIKEIKKQLQEQGFTHVNINTLENSTQLSLINTNNKKEYWKLLLILALSFFLIEMMLIKFWK